MVLCFIFCFTLGKVMFKAKRMTFRVLLLLLNVKFDPKQCVRVKIISNSVFLVNSKDAEQIKMHLPILWTPTEDLWITNPLKLMVSALFLPKIMQINHLVGKSHRAKKKICGRQDHRVVAEEISQAHVFFSGHSRLTIKSQHTAWDGLNEVGQKEGTVAHY